MVAGGPHYVFTPLSTTFSVSGTEGGLRDGVFPNASNSPFKIGLAENQGTIGRLEGDPLFFGNSAAFINNGREELRVIFSPAGVDEGVIEFQGGVPMLSPISTEQIDNRRVSFGEDRFKNARAEYFPNFFPGGGPDQPEFNYRLVDVEFSSNIIPEPTSLIVWSLLGCVAWRVGWRRRRRI